ncbi:hypothetical protein BLOT_002189 [Blomia tropicalis]|nr:hypothetical protein BLOT_002189 [Blomia tropicalis]
MVPLNYEVIPLGVTCAKLLNFMFSWLICYNLIAIKMFDCKIIQLYVNGMETFVKYKPHCYCPANTFIINNLEQKLLMFMWFGTMILIYKLTVE